MEARMKVYVRIPVSRKTICLSVEATETVALLKAKILREASISITSQRLYFDCEELSDDQAKLSQHNIQDGSTLSLFVCASKQQIQISVKSLKGNIITLDNIDPNVVMETLKSEIETLEGIPVYHQCLQFNDKPLVDGFKLSSYKIQDGSKLQLVPFCRELSVVTSTAAAGNDVIHLDVDPVQTVHDIKTKITAKEYVRRSKHHLFLSGHLLEDDYILSYYNIQDKSILHLVPENCMQIFIKTHTGTILPLTVDPFNTVDQIKAMLQQETHTEMNQLCLLHDNRSLVDNLTLSDQRVLNESTFQLANPCVEVVLKSLVVGSINVKVTPWNTISEVKAKGKQQGNIMFENKILNNDYTLSHYNIPNKSTLSLIPCSVRGVIDIFIKISFTGKTVALQVKPHDTLENLKYKIQDKEGIPKSQQCLVFNSVTLEDEHLTLTDYKIENNVTISLCIDSSAMIQLFIAKNTRDTLLFNVKPTARICDMKSIIQQKENISHSQLVFAGKHVKDESMLFDYNIHNGSTLTLVTFSNPEENYLLIFLQKQQQSNTNLSNEIDRLKTELSDLQQSYAHLQQNLSECEKQKKQQNEQYETQLLINEELLSNQQTLIQSLQINEIEMNSLKMKNQMLEERIKIAEENYIIDHRDVMLTKQELGRGGWGVIWLGVFRGQTVAVKRMHEPLYSPEYIQLLVREIYTMAQLRHPNLLQFIGAIFNDPLGIPMIITEIMDISLRNAYEKKQLTPVPICTCLSIMRDVAVGLNYLHCLPDPIIHRDVSSANVLLESKGPGKWKTKISDFGSAKLARLAITKASGAEAYSAPESLQSIVEFDVQKLTVKMDVFSYGILLCEVLLCQFPERAIFKNMLQRVSTQCEPFHSLIQSCIKISPGDRPLMKDVIEQLDSIALYIDSTQEI